MKSVFTKPVAHLVPLIEGTNFSALASMNDAELEVVWSKCKEAEELQVYQANPDVILREIGDEWMLVPTGQFAQHFNGMISLNSFSHFIWQQFEKPTTIKEALRAAHEQYDDPHHMMDIQVRKLVKDYLGLGVFGQVQSSN